MEKKYIIKLKENEIAYKTVNSNGCPMIGPLHTVPYIEPDLEQVRKEAYERGAEDMRKALRLLIDCDEDCLTIPDIFHTFREGSYHAVVRKHPAMEIIEKIRQYEQGKEEIKVGDEVEFDDGDTAIWMCDNPNEDAAYLMFSDGSCGSHENREIVRKTGRHFSEIAEVLKKMREE